MAATSFAIVMYGVGWEEKATGDYGGDPDYQVCLPLEVGAT